MTTAAYAIKRLIFDYLAMKSGPGKELDGVDVEYSYTGQMTDVCVYAGGVTFEMAGTDDVVDGDDVLTYELDTLRLYIRVVGRGLSVRQTEVKAESIGDVIGALLKANPRLAGPSTYTRLAGGTGDYQLTDDGPIVILAYRATTAAYV